MWSLEQIRAMNAEAGARARGKSLKPFLLRSKDQLDEMPPFPFPNLGDGADKITNEKIDSLFVDSSGLGSPTEPALTAEQLKYRLTRLLERHGELLVAIESSGQFQVYVGVWKSEESE